MQATQSLRQRFRSFRHRLFAVGSLTGLGWSLVAAAVVWLAVAWLDLLWELSPELRIGATVAALGAAALVIASALVFAWRKSRDAALARRLDRVGGTGGQILSGYDLARHGADKQAADDLTAGLAQLAVKRAAELAAVVPRARAISIRPLVQAAVVIVIVGLFVGGLATVAPRLAMTQWLRFSDPFGDHPPYSRIQFVVHTGDVKVLYGSGLDVHVTTDGPPVERMELVLKGNDAGRDEVLPMFPETGGRWRALLTRVTSPAEYYVRAARSRSHRFNIGVITIPRLENVRLKIAPPAYTGRPAYEGPLPQGGLAGLPGTQVRFWAKSNRPLKGGDLWLVHGQQRRKIELQPIDSVKEVVTGSFEITEAGKFELRVTDVAGHHSPEKFAGTITLLPDEKPFVRVRQPPAVSLATPNANLAVLVSGEDDYGISTLQLYRSLNESRARPLDLQPPQPAVSRFDGSQALPFSTYGLAPGDVIKLFARVEDNDPRGAKGSESPIAEVRIISQEEFERLVRARQGMEVLISKYRQAQRRLEALAEEQRGLRKKLEDSPADQVSDAAREMLRKHAQQLRKESEEIRKSAEHELPYDVDKNLLKHLQKLADSLQEQADQAESAANREKLTPEELAKMLEEMAKQLSGEREEFEQQAMDALEYLEQVFPLVEDQARFAELYKQQRDLAQRLASLKGRDGEDDPQLKARMRDLESEQQRLQQALQELLDDTENHASRLPDDERLDDLRQSALEFVDALRTSGAAEAMGEAAAGLAEFSGTRGHEGAQRAADILEKFMSKCEGMAQQGQACLKFQPSLAQSLGNSVEQLLGEAGLMPGNGRGGGTDGYSTSRSTLNNVGLYGQLPGMDQMAGRSGNRQGPGSSSSSQGTDAMSNPDSFDIQAITRASGSSEAMIPPRYRSKVGAYFQRIIEDSEQR